MIRSLLVSGFAGLLVLAAASTASADGASASVVCRTKSTQQGTMELTLKWDGSSAEGTLANTAPSGNVTTQKVRAERQNNTIIADDVFEKDLVSHAAVVSVKDGKRYMRTANVWLACE